MTGNQVDLQKMLIKKVTRRSAWTGAPREDYQFHCPQCRSLRFIPLNPQPNRLINIFRVLLTSLLFTILFFSTFGFKGLISFFPMWVIFESVYRLRLRSMLHCSSCGFDPYLYLQSPIKAREEIEKFWREKFSLSGIPFPGDPAPTTEEAAHAEESDEPLALAPASSTIAEAQAARR